MEPMTESTSEPTNDGRPWARARRIRTEDFLLSPYAGFWRRAWAGLIDGTIVGLISGLVAILLQLAAGLAYDAARDCEFRGGFSVCRGGDWVGWVLLGSVIAVYLFVWYSFVPRRMALTGQTVGMTQMGVRVQVPETARNISRSAAIAVAGINLLALMVGAAMLVFGVIVAGDRSGSAVLGALLIFGGLVIGFVLPSLMIVIDPRHQTLGDKLVNAVVVETERPSWFALASFMCGWFVFPLLFPLAIIFGHLGIHQTRWQVRRRAGRGIAVAGTLLGYLVPVIVLVSYTFTFTTKKIDSVNKNDCVAFRKELVIALESYKSLNGTYPRTLSPLAGDVYLNTEIDPDSWRYAPGFDPRTYVLIGTGNCARR